VRCHAPLRPVSEPYRYGESNPDSETENLADCHYPIAARLVGWDQRPRDFATRPPTLSLAGCDSDQNRTGVDRIESPACKPSYTEPMYLHVELNHDFHCIRVTSRNR
jgi:hypothetical protein